MTSLKELVKYIEEGKKRGHSHETLRKALLAQGVKLVKIEEAIEETKKVKKLRGWLDRHPFLKYWEPVIIYGIIILLISLMPAPPTPEVALGLAAIVTSGVKHFILYFGFSFLLGIACRHSKYWFLRLNHYTIAIAISILIGIIDEFNQGFVPGRYSEVRDVLTDALGAITAQAFRFVYKIVKQAAKKV